MRVRASALKYGIAPADSIAAAMWPVFSAGLDELRPQRVFRLGFDTNGRLLELVVLCWDGGCEEIIHAMKARSHYEKLLP